MLNISVSLNAEKVKRLLERAPEELRAAIELGSAKLLSEMQRTAQSILEQHAPFPAVAFGNLVRGIDFEVATQPPLGGMLFVKPPADVYALPVETGSRPHWIPLEPSPNLRPVRMKKDGTPRKYKAEVQVPLALLPWIMRRFPGIAPQEAVPFAFAIRGKIAKEVTRGVFFFERTRAAHEQDAAAAYDEFLDAAIARLENQAQ